MGGSISDNEYKASHHPVSDRIKQATVTHKYVKQVGVELNIRDKETESETRNYVINLVLCL